MAEVVVDASALVDLLIGGPLGIAVADRLASHTLHGPAHLGSETLSALGRLHRAGDLGAEAVETMLRRLVAAPINWHAVSPLVLGAWARRANLRLADALYVELATSLGVGLVTTDTRLAAVSIVDVVTV
ncbi:MAG: type II toxin-antitoxin system VapC family toxin [Acidimicrobiales bacterium]